jgi:hypothetical protein
MMLIMPYQPTRPPRPPRLDDLPRSWLRDMDDDEVTGVVEAAFIEEPSVPAAIDIDKTRPVLSLRELEEVETVYHAIRMLLDRHDGDAHALVRARLACALEES